MFVGIPFASRSASRSALQHFVRIILGFASLHQHALADISSSASSSQAP
jgi:hypothetical protein